jgi:hypothetical protein
MIYMSEKKTFGEMETLKWFAYDAGEMNVALFWQGEQVRKQLADIYFQGANK